MFTECGRFLSKKLSISEKIRKFKILILKYVFYCRYGWSIKFDTTVIKILNSHKISKLKIGSFSMLLYFKIKLKMVKFDGSVRMLFLCNF